MSLQQIRDTTTYIKAVEHACSCKLKTALSGAANSCPIGNCRICFLPNRRQEYRFLFKIQQSQESKLEKITHHLHALCSQHWLLYLGSSYFMRAVFMTASRADVRWANVRWANVRQANVRWAMPAKAFHKKKQKFLKLYPLLSVLFSPFDSLSHWVFTCLVLAVHVAD